MPAQQYGQPPAMRQPAGPPQFGGPSQRPPMTPNSAVAGPPGFGEGTLSVAWPGSPPCTPAGVSTVSVAPSLMLEASMLA